jgi:hypothetical protein
MFSERELHVAVCVTLTYPTPVGDHLTIALAVHLNVVDRKAVRRRRSRANGDFCRFHTNMRVVAATESAEKPRAGPNLATMVLFMSVSVVERSAARARRPRAVARHVAALGVLATPATPPCRPRSRAQLSFGVGVVSTMQGGLNVQLGIRLNTGLLSTAFRWVAHCLPLQPC